MPQGERRWCEYWVLKYIESKKRASEGWRENVGNLLKQLVTDGHRGRSKVKTVPPVFRRAGVDLVPLSPKDVSEEHIDKLREYAIRTYTPQVGRALMGEFRRFLKWAGNPLANDDHGELWEMPDGEAVNRRWPSVVEIALLLQYARTPREKAVIALLVLAGLRGVEVFRLECRNVQLSGPEPSLKVLGKGRKGGKWRSLPCASLVADYIRPLKLGRDERERLIPFSLETIQKDVVRVGERLAASDSTYADFRVSAHDLRRGFGVGYLEANGNSLYALLALKKWYGHARLETTIHYLRIDERDMAAGVARFENWVRKMLVGDFSGPTDAVSEEAL